MKYSIIQSLKYPQLNIKSLKYPQARLNLTQVNTAWVKLLKPPYGHSLEIKIPINQNVDYITKIMKKTTQIKIIIKGEDLKKLIIINKKNPHSIPTF